MNKKSGGTFSFQKLILNHIKQESEKDKESEKHVPPDEHLHGVLCAHNQNITVTDEYQKRR